MGTKTLQESPGYRHFEVNSRLRYFKPADSKTQKNICTRNHSQSESKAKINQPEIFLRH